MADGNMNQRDAKLVQWLNEAHAKESELEGDLTAHIALTEKQSYKKRLRQHLTETKDHKRRVAARIKQLGGSASSGPSLPGVPTAVEQAAGRAVAAVKGQVGTARAAVTSQAETHLRNAQEELREEHVEIAIYSRIQTFAEEVGDRETAQLAKSIRRDEERMAKFLDAELARLVKDVVRAEVPRAQRATTTRRRRSTGGRTSGRSRSSSRTTSSGRSRSSSSGRSTASRSSGRSSSSRSSGRSTASRSSGRSSSSRSSGRSTASRGTSSRRSSGSGGSSSGSRSSSSRSRSSSSGSRGSSSGSRSSGSGSGSSGSGSGSSSSGSGSSGSGGGSSSGT